MPESEQSCPSCHPSKKGEVIIRAFFTKIVSISTYISTGLEFKEEIYVQALAKRISSDTTTLLFCEGLVRDKNVLSTSTEFVKKSMIP